MTSRVRRLSFAAALLCLSRGALASGLALQVTPATASLAPSAAVEFASSGGCGTGIAWTIATNNSGATIDDNGVYIAGSNGGVSDVVTVTDGQGNTTNATVNVGAGVSIGAVNTVAPPRGALSFTASGGSGTGFVWFLCQNTSGGSIDADGNYVAGAYVAMTDIVCVTDSLGNSAELEVDVGLGVSITPSTPATAVPGGTIPFIVGGGSGTGYTWALLVNNSGATLDSGSGQYVAGPTPDVSDTVGVTDALGNTARVDIAVGDSFMLNPSAMQVAPLGAAAFNAVGGSGAYVYALATNNSGGSIDAATGVYTAGPTGGVRDVVQVSDALGDVTSAVVIVSGDLALSGATSVAPRGGATLVASGGAGDYVYALRTNLSGASIDSATGSYTAGATANVTDVVGVTDSNGAQATISITVGAGVSITAPLSVLPLAGVKLSATGGSGAGYTWALTANNSGATIDAAGNYTAGRTSDVSDSITVTDAVGNTATVSIAVGIQAALNGGNSGVTTGQAGLGGNGGVASDDPSSRGFGAAGSGCSLGGDAERPGNASLLLLAMALLVVVTRRLARLARA